MLMAISDPVFAFYSIVGFIAVVIVFLFFFRENKPKAPRSIYDLEAIATRQKKRRRKKDIAV